MSDPEEILFGCSEFQWDQGNVQKNFIKHGVTQAECEEVFFNSPLLVADDERHSHGETRYYVLGQTDAQRLLFVVFTVRGAALRVISARDMSIKEKRSYRSYEN
ncbi:MAG: BrnT family toxin [Methylacidiphilales bacterium]|nr:BrnT family toxin [Candidatus Methylacidiphilales bacterium]